MRHEPMKEVSDGSGFLSRVSASADVTIINSPTTSAICWQYINVVVSIFLFHYPIWVVVKIVVPYWLPIIIQHVIFKGTRPKEGP